MIIKRLKYLTCFAMAFVGTSLVASAQLDHRISGKVYQHSGSYKTPLSNATVTIQNMGLTTTTDKDGGFSFAVVPSGKAHLNFSFIGRVPLDTLIDVRADTDLQIVLQTANFRLREADVTAKADRNQIGTSSIISRNALDHLQATSLADIMALLPGGTVSNPDLSSSKQINIRNVVDGNSNTNAFGTGILLNGAPLNNNANLQTIAPTVAGGTSSLAGGADPSGGFDTRSISVDNIESVEVIRGVPSVEHGDITSGVVLVKTKAGEAPLRINAKTNPNVYQLSASKGILLSQDAGALNLGIDYAKNTNDPVQSYLYYQRLNASGQYSNTFFGKKWYSNTTLSVLYGKDTRKQNPDDKVTMAASSARDRGFSLNTEGDISIVDKWLKNINYVANVSYTHKKAFSQEQQTSATAPYSMTEQDGAILTNKPGTPLYDVQHLWQRIQYIS